MLRHVSRTLRVVLLPPLITLMIGLVVALLLAIGDSSDVKHPQFGSRVRLWGGFALMVSCLPVVFSASSAVPLRRHLTAFSVRRYRAVSAGALVSAWAASVVAIYCVLYLKPVWTGMLVSGNVLVVGGIVYGLVVTRPLADAPDPRTERTPAGRDV